jgi:hypothetical protein
MWTLRAEALAHRWAVLLFGATLLTTGASPRICGSRRCPPVHAWHTPGVDLFLARPHMRPLASSTLCSTPPASSSSTLKHREVLSDPGFLRELRGHGARTLFYDNRGSRAERCSWPSRCGTRPRRCWLAERHHGPCALWPWKSPASPHSRKRAPARFTCRRLQVKGYLCPHRGGQALEAHLRGSRVDLPSNQGFAAVGCALMCTPGTHHL